MRSCRRRRRSDRARAVGEAVDPGAAEEVVVAALPSMRSNPGLHETVVPASPLRWSLPGPPKSRSDPHTAVQAIASTPAEDAVAKPSLAARRWPNRPTMMSVVRVSRTVSPRGFPVMCYPSNVQPVRSEGGGRVWPERGVGAGRADGERAAGGSGSVLPSASVPAPGMYRSAGERRRWNGEVHETKGVVHSAGEARVGSLEENVKTGAGSPVASEGPKRSSYPAPSIVHVRARARRAREVEVRRLVRRRGVERGRRVVADRSGQAG